MGFYVGVDGCKAGWFAVWIDEDGAWCHRVFESIEGLYDRLGDASRGCPHAVDVGAFLEQ